MITLHPHQDDGIARLRASILVNQSVLFRAETGFGKTVCAAFVALGCYKNRVPFWFICHRRELVEQTAMTFNSIGVPSGLIMAGQHYDPTVKTQIVSIDSLKNRWDRVVMPKYVIIDECHHSVSASWLAAINNLKSYGVKIIGLTATPWRQNGEGFRHIFDDMVDTVDTAWLIDNGYLSNYRVFCPFTPDVSKMGLMAGEFATGAVEHVMGDAKLMGCAVENWLKYAANKRTIGFAPSIAMSQNMVEMFRANGIKAAHLDGETDKNDRRQIIRDYANGDLQVLWNVNLFAEGFDLSAIAGRDVPIEALIQYRPTMSLAMHRQQVGRALRPKPEPAIILDHAGNTERHGFQDDPIVWSLDGQGKRKKTDTVDSFKLCPQCLASHRPANNCPECGYAYPQAEVKPIEIIDGILTEVTRQSMPRPTADELRIMVDACKTYGELLQIEKRYGYKHGWAWKISRNRIIKGKP